MITLGYNNTPQDADREALKVQRSNRERVCKKRLATRARMAEIQFDAEMKRIENSEFA